MEYIEIYFIIYSLFEQGFSPPPAAKTNHFQLFSSNYGQKNKSPVLFQSIYKLLEFKSALTHG